MHNATTPAQRQAARDTLKGWEDDLRALAAQPAAEPRSAAAPATVTRRGLTPRRGKSFSAASNIAASSDRRRRGVPSLLARASYSGLPLARSRISSATSRS